MAALSNQIITQVGGRSPHSPGCQILPTAVKNRCQPRRQAVTRAADSPIPPPASGILIISVTATAISAAGLLFTTSLQWPVCSSVGQGTALDAATVARKAAGSNPLPAARIVIENELLTVKLVKDSTIIAPDSARDTVLLGPWMDHSEPRVGFLKNPAMHERKQSACSFLSIAILDYEFDLHRLKIRAAEIKEFCVNPCSRCV